MSALPSRYSLSLPRWLLARLWALRGRYESPRRRMELAITLARENARQGTGGPFGAAVFEADSGRLVAVGVNLVVASRSSLAHAEVVALALAQRSCGTHDLSAARVARHELVASAEPCSMCLGAIQWAGISALSCGARDQDVRAIGFDEGLKPPRWMARLRAAGIRVQRDLARAQACAVLAEYQASGGAIYNPVVTGRTPDAGASQARPRPRPPTPPSSSRRGA